MKRYWLFKAEPDVYGIEHLASAPHQTGRWDGIRNYQARNFLRDEVNVGDAVFIYHSHCKQPGIVGTAEITRRAYADPTQFNRESPYYDPKATQDEPRWVSVDIVLREIFAHIIPLTLIKQQAMLSEMVLIRQPRLSVQPIKTQEWKLLLQLR